MRVLLLVLLLVATPCVAAPLYLLGLRGPGEPHFSLDIVNQTTGVASVAVPLPSGWTPSGQAIDWEGLAHRPGDDSGLYTIHQLGGDVGGTYVIQSEIRRVDLTTGANTSIWTFDPASVGLQNAWLTSLAIDPSAPNRAVATVGSPGLEGVISIDLDTGTLTSPLIPADPDPDAFGALTFSPDGSTLYASTLDGMLGVLDPVTGVFDATKVAGVDMLSGLAFRPSDGALFGISAYNTDALVLLDPADRTLLTTVGRVGFGGPKELAFGPEAAPIPEPSPALLLLGGLTALRMQRGRTERARCV